MEWYQIASLLASFIGVPSLILLYIKRRLDKHDKKAQDREDAQTEFYCLLMESHSATITLADLTAECVKNERVNGNMDKARKNAVDVQGRMQKFVNKQGSKNLI
jgi:hypothetical protein